MNTTWEDFKVEQGIKARSPYLLPGRSFVGDFFSYVGRMKYFDRQDWQVYFAWIGMMLGLLFVVTFFTLSGYFHGVKYPAYVWNVPIGTFIFIVAIGIDTVGHRTAYKTALQSGESLVHHITICAGITSVMLLCLAYHSPVFFRIPAYVMVALSIFYSMIDEAMHWFRYQAGNSDRIEMWSHFFIFVGHTIMVLSWCHWFAEGYPGVAETIAALGW